MHLDSHVFHPRKQGKAYIFRPFKRTDAEQGKQMKKPVLWTGLNYFR